MESNERNIGDAPKRTRPPEGNVYARSDTGVPAGSPPPEGHRYAPGTQQTDDGNLFAEQQRSPDGAATETMDKAREGANQAADKAREGASQAADKAREQAEMGRERGAEGMERAASKVRDSMGDKDGMAGEAATRAADTLDRAAGYMKNHDTNEMMRDFQGYVREHPYTAMAGALAAGFLISRVLR